ncbi:MAG: precorrin-6y C5,15-methyltransferase (decarboxylating) subunit CbiE [Oscillospiraceae bacterium]|nr:precorrin-6y C5,15-methyltransferase (decarboxylating) subunit CbiE [Oscillospiraceae bacterium]
MKSVSVIGIGMSRSTLTAQALEAVTKADLLIGAPRMLSEFKDLKKNTSVAFLAQDILGVIRSSDADRIAVLFSGDVGFYSGASGLLSILEPGSVTVYPGISSAVYFFAKCGRPWQNAALVSCHGLETDLVSPVRRNREVFALTGGNVEELAGSLVSAGFGDLTVTVGESLSYSDENIWKTTVSGLAGRTYSSLTVLLIDNPSPESCVRSGIPDEEFVRSSVPMTKSEVRAVCLSKLRIRPTDVCYDIGCGTGSVTVEMALAAYSGHVYAFDKKQEAVDLTQQNCAAFHIGNVTGITGKAPEVLNGIPDPDVVFIGGSSGKIGPILRLLCARNPSVRFVITAICLETLTEAVSGLQAIGRDPEIVQVSVTRTKAVASLHMLEAQNPIFIVSDRI